MKRQDENAEEEAKNSRIHCCVSKNEILKREGRNQVKQQVERGQIRPGKARINDDSGN